MQRRSFLKGLGLLALNALPACRRAQEYAVLPAEGPEWQLAGEKRCYCSCMPWANGAFPLLAACPGGLPSSLLPHPLAARPGLPAFVQAALLDLYDGARAASPAFNGKDYPWEGLRGAFRAWAEAMAEGRPTGILFPEGWSALRHQQLHALRQLNPRLRSYAWDPVAEARPDPGLPELARMQEAALGSPCRWETGSHTLADLTRELPELELLFIFCPADPAAHNAAFAEALSRCEAETVRFHPRGGDRTATLCQYFVPQTHFLEEWGAEADASGQLCLRQPLTLPLRPALSEGDALAALLEGGSLPPEGHTDSPARRWLERAVPDLAEALRRGVLPHAAPLPLPREAGGEAGLYLHPFFADGRYAHNRWLQETYDSLSGAAGAPAVYLPGPPATGSAELGGRVLPACRLLGLARPLLPQLPGISPSTPARWREGAGDFPRQPAQNTPPLQAQDAPPPRRNADHPERPQWGLYLSLAACIGCQACTLACRAENNVPTVGAEEQQRGRDLQWLQVIRHIDELGHTRFFRPLACRHCENAPCEAACPVNATVHTSEGLNAMAYARCWGTRYCAAACPYGVRRFNFHDYAPAAFRKNTPPPNPQVTVRTRGVMEKCSLCVQRLNAARAQAAVSGQALTPPQPACAAACPVGAIRLVDLARETEGPRIITAFDAPGTKPRLRYLADKSL